MGRRRYTDEDRASGLAVLEANGGDVARTAKQLGVPYSTLLRWVEAASEATSQLRNNKKADLAARLEVIAHKLVDAIPDKIGEATLQQVATSLGIAVDKFRLLKGEPTEVTRNEVISRELPERAANAAAESLKRRGYVN